jgi:hypothetical protein
MQHIQPVGTEEVSFGEILQIMDFMIDMTSTDNFPESTVQYLPSILLQIVACLQEHCELIPISSLNGAIHLLCRIVSKIQPFITFESTKDIGKAFDCLSDIKEECESLTSEIIKATENALNTSQEKLDSKFNCTINLQQVCVKIELFFASIVSRRVLISHSPQSEIEHCFERITSHSFDSEENQPIDFVYVSDDCHTLYGSLCNLLVQTSLISLNTGELNNNGDIISINTSSLICSDRPTPRWLKQLVILSYCTHPKHLNINYTSIACVLNLMSVLKSQLLEQPFQAALINVNAAGSPVLDFSKTKPEVRATSTCIDFLFRQQDIQMLYTQTTYFLQIAERLWNNITEDLNIHHLQTASLLQQLHNLLEDSPICEGVICSAMAANDESLAYEARNKFCKLFNITRDMKQKNAAIISIREFDRPLFFMLDALTHKLDAFNALSLDWLHQGLVHNDIARILEPILLILLHPDTNRISVQHVNSQPFDESTDACNRSVCSQSDNRRRKDKSNEDILASEANIYAISSSDGNVVYHTSSDGKRRFASPSNMSAKSTSILNEPKSKRWPNFKPGTPEGDYSSSTRQLPVNINMFLNPFGSLSSLGSDAIDAFDAPTSFCPNELGNVRRLPGRRLLYSNDQLRKTQSASLLNTPLLASPRDANEDSHDSDVIGKLMDDMLDKVVEQLEQCPSESQTDGKRSVHNSFCLQNNGVDLNGYESSESSVSDSSSEPTRQTLSESFNANSWNKPVSVNQLHGHLLLYHRVYDYKRSLYALTTLWNLILAEPQKILFAMATTSVSNRIGVRSQELQHICARHKKSVIGKGFYGELDSELLNAYRNSSFLELIVTTCLYYIRSYYPAQCRMSEEEIQGNQKVRILSCEILRLIFGELIGNLKKNGTFATYIYDMLSRCSVQKYILHTIVSSVYNFQSKDSSVSGNGRLNGKQVENDQYSDALIDFNERAGSPGFQEDMQKSLLKLLEQLMILEHQTWPQSAANDKDVMHSKKDSESRASRIRFQPQMSSLKYAPNVMISSQSMFFSAVQTSLQQMHKANLHCNWLALVESSLPISNRSLTRIVVCVVTQLCHNLEHFADKIEAFEGDSSSLQMPPNYLISVLKSFSNLCHYCLLDMSGSSTQPIAGLASLSSPLNTSTTSLGPLQVLSNLFHTLSSNDNNPEAANMVRDSLSAVNSNANITNGTASVGNESLLSTRRTILSHLPRVLSSLLSLWNAVEKSQSNQLSRLPKTDSVERLQVLDAGQGRDSATGWQVMGSIKDVRNSILSLLNPISLIHGQSFMAAVAILWFDLKPVQLSFDSISVERRKPVIPLFSEQQISLVKLIAAIRVLPMESVFQIVRQVMKQPPNSMLSRKKRVPLEVCLLQFLLAYIREFPGSQLLECWRSVLHLLKDGSQLAATQPLMQFHLLAVLHEFVQIAPLIEARKDQKDLQDVAQKLIDSCTTVAGGRLGQSRWLRRNLEVKPGPQHLLEPEDESEKEMDELSNKFDSSSYDISNETTVAKYSVSALNALAEVSAFVSSSGLV